MEPDKELIIKMIQDLLEDPNLADLTKEEIAVLLHQDVILPLFEELREHFSKLAYSYAPYNAPSSTN